MKVFINKKSMAIREFIGEIGRLIPVLDSGNYHQQTVSVMKNNRWDYPYNKKISASLSLALHRLEIGNVIKLISPADDTDAMEMSRPLGLPSRAISAITLRGLDTDA